MAAPLVGFVVAFLTGAAAPIAMAEATFGSATQAIVVVDQKAATVYVRLPAICAATDPALDRLSDADVVCKDAKAPNAPAGRLKAAADALADIAPADNLIPPTKAPAR